MGMSPLPVWVFLLWFGPIVAGIILAICGVLSVVWLLVCEWKIHHCSLDEQQQESWELRRRKGMKLLFKAGGVVFVIVMVVLAFGLAGA